MTRSLSMTLAQYAASTSIEAIPAEVRARARQVILDEMGSARFGRQSMAGDLAARYARSLAGPGESRILGTRLRVPAQHAAFANGAAGHGDEVDGTHVVGGHPGATIVHAAVAVAERQRASGAELLNAVVLGYDVGVRVVEACGGKLPFKARSHLYSDFLYAIGATVAASRLLGLDPIRHCHAMALVTFQTNSLASLYQEKRHISKSLCNGQFALAGVSAALMSSMGMEGVEDVLGMKDGLLDAWGIEGGAQATTRQLGEDWAIRGANFKFINAGYPIHAAVEAATTLATEHAIDVASIESVHVGMPENAMRIVDGRDMHNICLQDMLSAALMRGGLSLKQSPFPGVLSDPAFARLRTRVTLGVDPGLNHDQPNGRGSNVTITTESGLTVSRRVDFPRGHSRRGELAWADLSAKWHDLLPSCDVDRMLALAQRLDDLDDVNELSDAFGETH
jgi:2-methylcitrate dehydratase PrpD